MTDKDTNILKLIDLFKKNPDLSIADGIKQVSISRRWATIIKQWVKDGCNGIPISTRSRNDYRLRRKSNTLVEVECLGPGHETPYKFWSESKFIRLCPNCTISRKNPSYEDTD